MKERGEDVCFRKSQDGTREACFLLSPLLNSLIHGATPPPFCLIQRDSISILVPSFALPINPFLPCVGAPKCPSLFRKVSENGESCSSYLYSKSRGGRTAEENEGFSKETGRLGGIRAVTPRPCTLFTYPQLVRGIRSPAHTPYYLQYCLMELYKQGVLFLWLPLSKVIPL